MQPELNPPPHTYAVRVGIGVLVFDADGLLLLHKRKGRHAPGTWSTAGGHMNFGETPEECAKREVLEETGVVIRDPAFIGFTNDVFEESGRHYITLWMKAGHDSGEAVVNSPEEVEAVGWFPLDALPSPLFLPLRQLLEGKLYASATSPV